VRVRNEVGNGIKMYRVEVESIDLKGNDENIEVN